MAEKKNSGSGIYIIAITAFFLGCFLLLVVFGTNIFRAVADRQAGNNSHRAVLGYLLTITRMSETLVTEADDPEFGHYLIVEDAGTGYGSRIYVSDGFLVEDYGKVKGALHPDYATQIGKTDTLEISRVQDDLLKLTTDQGSVFIHVE